MHHHESSKRIRGGKRWFKVKQPNSADTQSNIEQHYSRHSTMGAVRGGLQKQVQHDNEAVWCCGHVIVARTSVGVRRVVEESCEDVG